MNYQNKVQVTFDLIDNTDITDEHIFRRCIYDIIKSIPLDELRKVFKLEKLNPRNDELWKMATDTEFREKIRQLELNQLIEYKVSVDIL